MQNNRTQERHLSSKLVEEGRKGFVKTVGVWISGKKMKYVYVHRRLTVLTGRKNYRGRGKGK